MAGRGEYTLTMIRKPEVTPKVLNNSDDMGPGMDISGYCQNNGWKADSLVFIKDGSSEHITHV